MVIKINYIEIYVANIIQSKYFYIQGFGFKEIYTKYKENTSFVTPKLHQGIIKKLMLFNLGIFIMVLFSHKSETYKQNMICSENYMIHSCFCFPKWKHTEICKGITKTHQNTSLAGLHGAAKRCGAVLADK